MSPDARKKPRLYRATAEIDVLFLLGEGGRPEWAAKEYLQEEIDANGLFNVVVSTQEITDRSKVPKNWRSANLWGAEEVGLDEEFTPDRFFEWDESQKILDEIGAHQKAIEELKKRLAEK